MCAAAITAASARVPVGFLSHSASCARVVGIRPRCNMLSCYYQRNEALSILMRTSRRGSSVGAWLLPLCSQWRSYSVKSDPGSAECGGVLGSRSESLVDVPVKLRPRKYFDAKRFRQFLRRYKQAEVSSERRVLQQQYARPPPEGWGPVEFMRKIGLEENAEAVAAKFSSWGEFVTASPEDLMRIECMTNAERRLLLRHLRLFLHGLWPENTYEDYMKHFQAKPLEREGEVWTDAEDELLLDLAKRYDSTFGDPWLYISWEMQRSSEEVQWRYLQLVEVPKNKIRRCEFALTRCTRPLFFTRYFKLLPSFLFIVPSRKNFNTEPKIPQLIPPPFQVLLGEEGQVVE